MNKIKVALVGNPNAGKTSLFNRLTGQNQKTGNFAGVTVERKIGSFDFEKTKFEIIDLPGTYSIYAKSIEEQVVINSLLDKKDPYYPDIIIVLLDQTALKRNFLLFSQIIELQLPIVPVLNMTEQAEQRGIYIDPLKFEAELGLLPVSINARDGKGLTELKQALLKPQVSSKKFYHSEHAIIPQIRKEFSIWNDYEALQYAHQYQLGTFFTKADVKKLNDITFDHSFNAYAMQREETEYRYKSIDKVIAHAVDKKQSAFSNVSANIDRFMVHPVYGYLSFIFVLFLIFQLIFNLSAYPMDAIDAGMGWLGETVGNILPQGYFNSLITEGIIAGIGGVVIFIPQIAFLFGILSILEDSGYMSRVMFISDKFMRRFGLNGRSIIPLVSGVACAVPAVMAARNIESKKERLITILVTPFMSCAARLPVYTILISLAIPAKVIFGFLNLQGIVLMGLYLLGVVVALIAAFFIKIMVKSEDPGYLIMELPEYRKPNWRNVGLNIYNKSKTFTLEAGKIILIISVILWGLASFGPGDSFEQAKAEMTSAIGTSNTVALENAIKAKQLEVSYAGIIGKSIEPAIKPLGYDWKIGIALITSFAAREVFVGTISTLYSLGGDDQDTEGLKARLLKEKFPDGTPVYSFATVISLLLFYAFAMQCMSTLAIVKRETQTYKWPIIQLFMMSGLAYVTALIAYQVLK